MFRVNGLLSIPARRRLRELDFRAPEDRLSVDEGDERGIRSPGIDRMINAYYDADHADDDSEKATALRGMLDEMTALHKLRGVPVFAHPPLPPQFVAAQADGSKYAGGSDIVSKIASLIEPNSRAAVKMQLEGALARQRGPLAEMLSPRASEPIGGIGLRERWPDAADLSAPQLEAPGADRRAKCQLARQRMADFKQELGFNLGLQRQLGERIRWLDDQIRDLRARREQLVARVRSMGPAHDRSPKSAELARLGAGSCHL
jgi:hypothetical protein